MTDISAAIAFGAGLLSFFSPCIFPLLPAYAANLTGALIAGDRLQSLRSLVLLRSFAFAAGFSLVFLLLGASASALGSLLLAHKELLERAGGVLVIIFGLQLTGWLQISTLARGKQWAVRLNKPSLASSVLLGIAFGAGWTPCVGLTLASILLLAGSSGSASSGALLLGFYSAGLALPFIAFSLALTYSMTVLRLARRLLPALSLASAILLIALGLLMVSGRFGTLSAWFAGLLN